MQSFEADRDTGLIFARVLDGRGGATPIGWEACRHWRPTSPEQTLWLHVDRTVPAVGRWLQEELGLAEETAGALLAEATRPRAFREGEALVAVLRGINMNPEADPEDMVTLRIWARANRVLTLRGRPMQTPRDLMALLDRGAGPRRTGDLVAELVEQLIERMGGSIIEINDRIDRLEEKSGEIDADVMLSEIATIRRYSLGLKRHMSPQHEALERIAGDPPSWLGSDNCRVIRETIDRLRRYLEDLDVSKESVLVLQDDLNNRANTQTNRRLYLLSVAAAIFLPVSFVTAVMGVNVGGLPWQDEPMGFWLLLGLLGGLVLVQLAVLRMLKWL